LRTELLKYLIVIGALLLIIRLFYLQIIDESYELKAENNAIKIEYTYPERGYIYDRNGRLIVSNQSSYDLMVVPRDIKNLDTLTFCKLLNVDTVFFNKQLKKAITYERRLPSVFLSQLTIEDYSKFNERLRNFEGFYIQKRFLRRYHVDFSGNVFGFIQQVNQNDMKKSKYYNLGDLIGRQGIEQEYEKILRGQKGVKYLLRDKFNRVIGSYKEGKYDTLPRRGPDVTLSIDIELQKYGEQLMKGKWGGIVAIEPSTGEILALVSTPSYDPSLLVGRSRSKNYTELYNDSIAKPLYDRGLLAEYPPGSPFKILTALVALQSGAIDTTTAFSCRRGAMFGRKFQKCHDVGTFSLNAGMYHSCNTYFGNIYRKTIDQNESYAKNMDDWKNHLKSFGLSGFMGVDMPTGRPGHIPGAELYDRIYGVGHWNGTTNRSNAIGQGEIVMTPLQLSNMMAITANEGHFFVPHMVKKIENQKIDKKFRTKRITTVERKHFIPVKNALADVYNKGTARRLKSKVIVMGGKTGTAENFARINGKKVQLKDHSIFVAFAPKDKPKIAIAVFVENGGFGATIAGPIATLMAEKYILNRITRKDLETSVLSKSLRHEYLKLYPKKPIDTTLMVTSEVLSF
jgi:penicillin-binding protein 2